MEQALDFLKDCRSLHSLMSNRPVSDFKRVTEFKDWTVSDVFGHLYIFNIAAIKTLEIPEKFDKFFEPFLM